MKKMSLICCICLLLSSPGFATAEDYGNYTVPDYKDYEYKTAADQWKNKPASDAVSAIPTPQPVKTDTDALKNYMDMGQSIMNNTFTPPQDTSAYTENKYAQTTQYQDSSQEAARIRSMLMNPQNQNLDSFDRAMLELQIKRDASLQERERQELMQRLKEDFAGLETTAPAIDSYDGYKWAINELKDRGGSVAEKAKLADYLRTDNKLGKNEKMALLKDLGIPDTDAYLQAAGPDDSTLSGRKSPITDPSFKDKYKAISPDDYENPYLKESENPYLSESENPYMKKDEWKNKWDPMGKKNEDNMPYEEYEAINDYYKQSADELMEQYNVKNYP